MSEPDQEIQLEGDPKAFFFMLPNMADDDGLSLAEYRLLGHYARVGNCWEGTRTTAKHCGMGLSTVVNTRRSLADKGWLSISESEHGTLLVVLKDRWQENAARSATETLRVPLQERTRSATGTKEYYMKKRKAPRSSDAGESSPPREVSSHHGEASKTNSRVRDVLFDAIAEVCVADPVAAGSSIAKVKQALDKAGYSAEDVRAFGVWWWSDDWRKKRDVAPTVWQLRERIAIVRKELTPKSTIRAIPGPGGGFLNPTAEESR